jgi:riboflavin kinase / FMN adenylyltransferase
MRVYETFAQLSAIGAPVFVTVGFFDGVHRGHQYLFERLIRAASSRGAEPLVVTFRNSPKNYHQQPLGDRRPRWRFLNTCEERLDLIEQAGIPNVLLLHYGENVCALSARQFLSVVAGHCALGGFCAGYDTSIGCDMLSGRDSFVRLTRELGIELEFVEPYAFPLHPDGQGEACVVVKSSLARELIAAGDLASAQRVLGHAYFISGLVVRGKGLGGPLLGIHTANLHIPPEKITPPSGIYAAWADVGGELYPAATALAEPRRAFDTVLDRQAGGQISGQPPAGFMVAEAHLIGYSGDLYGERLCLSFVARLRGWEDFDSAAGLEAQMREDIAMTLRACGAEAMADE